MLTRMQQTNKEESAQLELVFYARKNKPSETLLGHRARTTFQGLYSSNVQSI
jgi:hypothetical protein